MWGRRVWWLSTVEAHVTACMGASMLVPTLGLVPIWMVLRGQGGPHATHHVSWTATFTALLIAAAVVTGRVVPDLMVGLGPAWSETEGTLRCVGGLWMFVAFCAPVMSCFGHGLAAWLVHQGVGVRRRRVRVRRGARRGPVDAGVCAPVSASALCTGATVAER